MGCLWSRFKKETFSPSDIIPLNSQTVPLRRIPKFLYFRNIIPSELNFEVVRTSDGQFHLSLDNKEIRFGFVNNIKRYTIAELQAMLYPAFNDNYRVTIGLKEFESIQRHEHILVPFDTDPNINLSQQFPSIYNERLSNMNQLDLEASV